MFRAWRAAAAAATRREPAFASSLRFLATGRRVCHRVAVGLSGGVDSAVAAAVLREQGHDVVGVFMRNWDEKEERGVCTSEADAAKASAIAQHLGIPFHRVDFVREYWQVLGFDAFAFAPGVGDHNLIGRARAQHVFEAFLADLEHGFTPNPDVLCNRHVKFGAFLAYARTLGATHVATGHYARVGTTPAGDPALLRAADDRKDQTCVPRLRPHPAGLRAARRKRPVVHRPSSLRQIFRGWHPQDRAGAGPFPRWRDAEKRGQAARPGPWPRACCCAAREHGGDRGWPGPIGIHGPALVRYFCSVQGICFIGKRDFSDFLRQYMPDAPGRVVLLDAHGAPKGAIATHRGCHFHTLGQRVRLGGRGGRTYVVGKDLASRTLYVVNDAAHAALATIAFHAARPQWTDAAAMAAVLAAAAAAPVPLAGRARHQQPLFACAAAGRGADGSAVHAPLYPGGTRVGFVPGTGSPWSLAVAPAGAALTVTVEGPPLQGMAPGQWLVLYDGEVCLGGATIVANVTEMAW